MKPITFYDLTSRLRTKAWSPNTWKTRYALNYKRLPYNTEWVKMEDISTICKKIGATPTQHKRDGTPIYTLPVIFDPNTNLTISESLQIADYLDKQYPHTPPLIQFPALGAGHQAREAMLQAAFVDSFRVNAMGSLWQFMIPRIVDILHEDSTQAYFRTTREAMFRKPLEEVVPKRENGEWEREWLKVKKGFDMVDGWFKVGESEGDGAKWTGHNLSFADFVVGSCLKYIQVVAGEDSKEWKDVMSWSGGRWKRLSDELRVYDHIDNTGKL